jgi:hypothetical protein
MHRLGRIPTRQSEFPIREVRRKGERSDELRENHVRNHRSDAGDAGHGGNGRVDHLLTGCRPRQDRIASLDMEPSPVDAAGAQRFNGASLEGVGDRRGRQGQRQYGAAENRDCARNQPLQKCAGHTAPEPSPPASERLR